MPLPRREMSRQERVALESMYDGKIPPEYLGCPIVWPETIDGMQELLTTIAGELQPENCPSHMTPAMVQAEYDLCWAEFLRLTGV